MSIVFRAFAVLLVGLSTLSATADEAPQDQVPRNVIFLLGDGMGPAYIKAWRYFSNDPLTPIIDPLPIDALHTGAIATDSIVMKCEDEAETRCVRNPYGVTDSAASATAYATGVDTINGRVGVDMHGEPLTSVLEMAARQGKGTGVVSTSQVTHASPAAFVAHVEARRNYPEIADDFFDNQVDGKPMVQVILGGGIADFEREDRDVAAQLVAAGYDYVQDREALVAADELPLLGLFAPVGMPRHWDRPESTPTLAEMTDKAIDLLARNDEGFFLMVEGSQIDWAGHGKDISGVMSEMQGFMEAIDVALAFAAERGDTLVVVTADHETGGLSVARDGLYEWNPLPLRGMASTPERITGQFMMDGEASLDELLQAAVEFELTPLERQSLRALERDESEAYDALTEIMNDRTRTGWTSHGHTGVDVPLYATGPGSQDFRGVLQNEELGQLLIKAIDAPVVEENAVRQPEIVNAVLDGLVADGSLPFIFLRVEDRDGNVIYEHGARNPDLVPFDIGAEDWVRIWSMSKIVTIVTVLDLVEEGLLSLDDPITRFIPEFGNLAVAVGPQGQDLGKIEEDLKTDVCPVELRKPDRPATVRDLINHEDGFYYAWNNIECLDDGFKAINVSTAANSKALIDRLAGLPLINQPGTEVVYGFGTTVLGLVAERASGKSLDELVRERVTGPLGIEGLRYGLPDGAVLPPRFIADDDGLRVARPGEVTDFGENLPDYYPSQPLYLGGEGMLGTAEGYADFARMLLNRGALDNYRVLEPETVQDIRAPHTMTDNEWGHNGYNLWISNGRLADGSYGPGPLWIGGGWEGTHFWVDPEHELVGVLMTQIHNAPPGAANYQERIRMALYRAMGWQAPDPETNNPTP